MTTQRELVRGAFVIPAYDPGPLLAKVIASLLEEMARARFDDVPIVVVDDGCRDGSTTELPDVVTLLRHNRNLGKGAALQTALDWAHRNGFAFIVTLDADNQHPAREAVRLFAHEAPFEALVLAVRDLRKAGAPLPNRLSNGFSNWILSLFGGEKLLDTQCGLRRYPVVETLALGAVHPGYAFESEVVLRAARTGLPIAHVEAEVTYARGQARVSHFDSLRDPGRNVVCVVETTWKVPHQKGTPRFFPRLSLIPRLVWQRRNKRADRDRPRTGS